MEDPEFLFGPVPNKEAADFIKGKPVVSKDVFDGLLPVLKARAFVIAGVEAANVVQQVRDSIATLPLGGDWDEIKKQIVDQIHPFLANPEDPTNTAAAERRAELLMRTHGFQAYQASNLAVMEAQKDVFPYWQYLSMQDGRVRASHRALEGKVLPANHPFWNDHKPPWDWNCRCQVVPLSPEDVEELEAADKDKPPEEHRVLPQHVLDEIDRTGHLVTGPNMIADVRSPKAKGLPGAYEWDPEALRIPVDRLKDRYDADIWRAFEEWAQKTNVDDVLGSVWDWLNGTPTADGPQKPEAPESRRPVRAEELFPAIDEVQRGFLAPEGKREEILRILEIASEDRTEVAFSSSGGPSIGNIHTGFDFVRRFTAKTVFAGPAVQIVRRRRRAMADRNGRWIDGRNMSPKTVVHELGHIIEARSAEIIAKSIKFLESRTQGESPTWLGPGYGRKEKTLRDDWVKKGGSVYSGKVYRDASGTYATEILSMGLQRLLEDPLGFYLNDREYFSFVVNVLRDL